MQIFIRKAKFDDLEAVLDLVKDLAEFEKSENEVTANLDDYQIGYKNKDFEALVAVVHGKIVATAIYYLTWSTWKGRMMYLEDFIVKDIYRRFGVGQKLFEAFLVEAEKMHCKLAKWQVLDWNTPAIKFYEKNDALIDKDWWNVKIMLEN